MGKDARSILERVGRGRYHKGWQAESSRVTVSSRVVRVGLIIQGTQKTKTKVIQKERVTPVDN